MELPRSRPAKDRPGAAAWFGPLALGLALISWLFPIGALWTAGVALALAVLSMATDRAYRLDWTAVAGCSLGVAQFAFTALLLVVELSPA
ncbi:hypothetical protein [Actinosynnema mirum]|uniref:Uncharacterized protein n=1 Tax=Actinosynnema mirum (strain ATCC 29888 / DSM 43827 / JCM 3225 / NBRC 14064 / NCIMB 13271 / NRRL B-12336 / IMRU 3971 / 101) TaxID=446462 RepID=C6WIU7_ACTMD|nr:hypothetical protein [Actinosynnema mirum]ACU38187.1 hypothetical protein Amir_4336 [Actinosynnema mirum DSM 43827]